MKHPTTISLPLTACLVLFLVADQASSQTSRNTLLITADSGQATISRHLFGQFSEHLGRGIYGGIWVGDDSPIPNRRGIRNDVVAALKKIKVPNVRWPGGCFADEYHWLDGVGPRDQRPKMINTHWGGVTEDNSFGTHEFMELCDQLGAEPYICGNVGSGSVEEMSKWVEYVTFGGTSPMADLRRKHGRNEPWKVQYWGVGNENWGCGGNMTAEYYADLYRRYATYCRNYGDNRLFKVAGGANSWDFNWTKVLMQKINPWLMNGLSVHYYTVNGSWEKMESATQFNESGYAALLMGSSQLDSLLTGHVAVMDTYDHERRVKLIVDEWGAWHKAEPGSTPGFLYQQNTLRDAFVAALSLNILMKHSDRVAMANIAQTVNVLQAMILTDGAKMILTPTYHVFDLYKGHQDARLLTADLQSERYESNGVSMPALSAACSQAPDGSITMSVVNVHPTKSMPLECRLGGRRATKATGSILTAATLNAHNTFAHPDEVRPAEFTGVTIENNQFRTEIPPRSIVVLSVR